ncbi:hypothetical protein G6F63_016925 [Rhizopus arrhizus]|nr:hypothetical protein G6F63_016925 [Rhizopus arrhizus]
MSRAIVPELRIPGAVSQARRQTAIRQKRQATPKHQKRPGTPGSHPLAQVEAGRTLAVSPSSDRRCRHV